MTPVEEIGQRLRERVMDLEVQCERASASGKTNHALEQELEQAKRDWADYVLVAHFQVADLQLLRRFMP